jgi:hypothetical protein
LAVQDVVELELLVIVEMADGVVVPVVLIIVALGVLGHVPVIIGG